LIDLDLTQAEKEIQRILEDRARELARLPKQKTKTGGEIQEFLILEVGNEFYGVHIENVQEIQLLKGLAPVPGTPDFWAGLINLRGRLVPALDLRRYMGLVQKGAGGGSAGSGYSRVVIVNVSDLLIALLVHEVNDVRRFGNDSLRPPVKDMTRTTSAVVTAITPDLISILDLGAILADPRIVVDEHHS